MNLSKCKEIAHDPRLFGVKADGDKYLFVLGIGIGMLAPYQDKCVLQVPQHTTTPEIFQTVMPHTVTTNGKKGGLPAGASPYLTPAEGSNGWGCTFPINWGQTCDTAGPDCVQYKASSGFGLIAKAVFDPCTCTGGTEPQKPMIWDQSKLAIQGYNQFGYPKIYCKNGVLGPEKEVTSSAAMGEHTGKDGSGGTSENVQKVIYNCLKDDGSGLSQENPASPDDKCHCGTATCDGSTKTKDDGTEVSANWCDVKKNDDGTKWVLVEPNTCVTDDPTESDCSCCKKHKTLIIAITASVVALGGIIAGVVAAFTCCKKEDDSEEHVKMPDGTKCKKGNFILAACVVVVLVMYYFHEKKQKRRSENW